MPRWAVNNEALEKVINFQKKEVNAVTIFGKLKPAIVAQQFTLSNVFSKGEDAKSYMD